MSDGLETMSEEAFDALSLRMGRLGLDAWWSDEREQWGIYPLEDGDFGDPLAWCPTIADVVDWLDKIVVVKPGGQP
jgi:hypothetical protein